MILPTVINPMTGKEEEGRESAGTELFEEATWAVISNTKDLFL